jgi:predicted Fe-Mo cluster-binding NifX family protein
VKWEDLAVEEVWADLVADLVEEVVAVVAVVEEEQVNLVVVALICGRPHLHLFLSGLKIYSLHRNDSFYTLVS